MTKKLYEYNKPDVHIGSVIRTVNSNTMIVFSVYGHYVYVISSSRPQNTLGWDVYSLREIIVVRR
jgi:hypothetical protein